MKPMCNITKEIYETNFNELMQQLREFIKSKHPSSYPETTGEKGVLDVLLEINHICSTRKGRSSPPLFVNSEVSVFGLIYAFCC
jgi:hypothetical protein